MLSLPQQNNSGASAQKAQRFLQLRRNGPVLCILSLFVEACSLPHHPPLTSTTVPTTTTTSTTTTTTTTSTMTTSTTTTTAIPPPANLTCPFSTTLASLVTCIRDQMPQSGSEGYVAPTSSQQADWKTVVDSMLQGVCDFAVPTYLNGIMQVSTFTDTGNGRAYCVLMEILDQDHNGFVDYGFGTFIVYNPATRFLSHQAVHPLADATTEMQSVILFRDTDSHSYLMAGAHRNANAAISTCLASETESDASHNNNTMVQATQEALLAHYGTTPWFALQWHGMATSTCPNTEVYLSHGMDLLPGPTDKVTVLRDYLLIHHLTWDVDLPGSGACSLNATKNMQGRLLNGVAAAQVCSTAASSYTQKFIHVEQDPSFRNPSDWVAPLIATFP